MPPQPPTPTLFPYTTLFRSVAPCRESPRTIAEVRAQCYRAPRRGSDRAAPPPVRQSSARERSEEHTSELQSLTNLVCRLLLEKKKTNCRKQLSRIYEWTTN